MKPNQTAEWKKLKSAEKEGRIMARLLKGDVLQPSISQEKRGQLETEGFPSRTVTDKYLSEWSRAGIISGFVPVLSEKGREMFASLGDLTREIPSVAMEANDRIEGQCPYCPRPISEHTEVRCETKSVVVSRPNHQG